MALPLDWRDTSLRQKSAPEVSLSPKDASDGKSFGTATAQLVGW